MTLNVCSRSIKLHYQSHWRSTYKTRKMFSKCIKRMCIFVRWQFGKFSWFFLRATTFLNNVQHHAVSLRQLSLQHKVPMPVLQEHSRKSPVVACLTDRSVYMSGARMWSDAKRLWGLFIEHWLTGKYETETEIFTIYRPTFTAATRWHYRTSPWV